MKKRSVFNQMMENKSFKKKFDKEKQFLEKENNSILLKLSAWVYRKTGYMSNYAKRKEWEYIYNNLEQYYINYENNKDDMKFSDYISVQIGSWQAKHGFYRRFKCQSKKF